MTFRQILSGLHPERVRGQPRPGEAGIDHIFPAIVLVAEMDHMARQPDLGAFRVAQQHEGGFGRTPVSGEHGPAEAQILAVLHHEGAVGDGLAHAGAGFGAQPIAPAHCVSMAVLARMTGPRALAVVGSGRGAVHLDLDGFIVTVTGPGVPWMPNGVVVGALADLPRVSWHRAAPPAWDPVVDPVGGSRAGVVDLARWLSARIDAPPIPIEEAGERLIGRGRGLTPEGDDILAGAAVGLRALAPSVGLDADRIARLIAALCPADTRSRTGALSATLLELAVQGAAPEPVHRLLASGDRETALADLRRLGASTGGAIAAGITLAAEYLIDATAPA